MVTQRVTGRTKSHGPLPRKEGMGGSPLYHLPPPTSGREDEKRSKRSLEGWAGSWRWSSQEHPKQETAGAKAWAWSEGQRVMAQPLLCLG